MINLLRVLAVLAFVAINDVHFAAATLDFENLADLTCLALLNRPGQVGTLPLPQSNPRLARHHIIPFNTLRDFYTTIWDISNSAESKNDQTRALRRVINSYIRNLLDAYMHRLHENRLPADDDLVDQAIVSRMRLYQQRLDLIIPQDLFHSLYVWMPGNIFMGPSPNLRSDDPGNSFETGSRPIIGDAHYDLLSDLHDQMRTFIETIPERRNMQTLLRILSSLNRVMHHDIIEYNTFQWVKETVNGRERWRIKRREEYRDLRRRQVTPHPQQYPPVLVVDQEQLKRLEPYCLAPVYYNTMRVQYSAVLFA